LGTREDSQFFFVSPVAGLFPAERPQKKLQNEPLAFEEFVDTDKNEALEVA